MKTCSRFVKVLKYFHKLSMTSLSGFQDRDATFSQFVLDLKSVYRFWRDDSSEITLPAWRHGGAETHLRRETCVYREVLLCVVWPGSVTGFTGFHRLCPQRSGAMMRMRSELTGSRFMTEVLIWKGSYCFYEKSKCFLFLCMILFYLCFYFDYF